MLKVSRLNNQRGAATLVFATILLVITTLIVFFAANSGALQQKIAANNYRNQQAFQAAEAGMEYAIPYLQANRTTIAVNGSNGYIPSISNSSITNVTLSNGSKYTIVYSNPTAYNYNLIKITVTGYSEDATATRSVSQLVQYGSTINSTPTLPAIVQDDISLFGLSEINNYSNANTIRAGDNITFWSTAHTTTSSGGSNYLAQGSDVVGNYSALKNASNSSVYDAFFGTPMNFLKSRAGYSYQNSTDTNYSTALQGKTNAVIWITQTNGSKAILSGNTTVGTSSSPVLLIVDGNLNLTNNAIVYGLVYVMDTQGQSQMNLNLKDNSRVTGAAIVYGDMNTQDTSILSYSASVLSNLQSNTSYFAKVPGSWKDF